jgi:hypothetical protein
MFKIDYEIKLNDNGRPCVELSEDYIDKAEDKFFALELSRYFLQGVYSRKSQQFDNHTAEMIDVAVRLLGQIGDEMAEILFHNMKAMGELDMMLDNKYHIMVKTLEERDSIEDKPIVYDGKIFYKMGGLKIFVTDEQKTYKYKHGDNHWKEVK